jgi:hypothetical protein
MFSKLTLPTPKTESTCALNNFSLSPHIYMCAHIYICILNMDAMSEERKLTQKR